MKDLISILCLNNRIERQFPIGISLLEIYESLKADLPDRIICARVNNVNEGLNFRLYHSKSVEFLTLKEPSGMRVYIRSLCFILYKAIRDIYPQGTLNIEHPVSKGLYCRISTGGCGAEATAFDVERIVQRMREIVSQDIRFVRHERPTSEVADLFENAGMNDKACLLRHSQSVYSYYYQLDNEMDYYYGVLAPSTGYISLFELVPYEDGIILLGPNRTEPDKQEVFVDQPLLFQSFLENNAFNKIVGLSNVGVLNEACVEGKASQIIKLSEALQERKIIRIADEIIARKTARIVLISGPSSSGKTTFSKRLEVQLWANLAGTVTISMDDYFVDRAHTPLDENGEHDFESLYAIDLDLFNTQIQELLEGKEVSVPTYNFALGKKEYLNKVMKMSKSSLLIIEGIHALNPAILGNIPRSKKFCIYASALTTISLDDHNWIPTTDNRLIRRIVRDANYRAYPAKNTIARWASVRRGEDKWIFPHQENADAMFNSAMIYELAVLKKHAEPILHQVPRNCPEYAEAARLLNFLAYFNPIRDEELPPTSLLREFFGGSSFKY